MKIYDITKEVFEAEVYPGDPEPYWRQVMTLDGEEPDNCQLSEMVLGSHTGTHLDAPRHYRKDGADVADMDLARCMGPCYVVAVSGKIGAKEMKEMLAQMSSTQRILFKGKAVITEEAAEELVQAGIVLVGVEELTVGPISSPDRVHKILLGQDVVIVESLDLSKVSEGEYEFVALPLKMKGLDGSPVRAVLVEK